MHADFSQFVRLAMETARRAADKGSQVAYGYFKKDLQSEVKDDLSPVTIADREAEAAIIACIRTIFPSHSILGEESGYLAGDKGNRWIIDPIDGTRGFIRGGSFWGSLVALEHEGRIIAGAASIPVQECTYSAGQGQGCFRNDQRVQLSKVANLRDATLSLGELQHLLQEPHREAILDLIRSAGSNRCYGDPGGLMMVLDGLADVWLEAGVKPWDLAPASILIAEAGGRFSNFEGGLSLDHGNAIVSNGLLHEEILKRLKNK